MNDAVANGQPGDDHVCIADGFHFVNVIIANYRVEACVQIVQEIHHLEWCALGGHGRETDDIAEVDGDLGRNYKLFF